MTLLIRGSLYEFGGKQVRDFLRQQPGERRSTRRKPWWRSLGPVLRAEEI